MNQNDLLTSIRAHIDRQYEQLAKRPDLFCHPVAIETFVFALEGILDMLNGFVGRAD